MGPGAFPQNSRPQPLGWRFTLAALAGVALPACELAEVATEPGRDLLVVEAILRADADHQLVLLHRSISDGRVLGEPNAVVKILGPLGEEYLFVETSLGVCADGIAPEATDSIDVRASCYINPVRTRVPIVRGITYGLSVLTTDGRELRGRTTVPGRFQFRDLPGTRTGVDCSLPPDTNFPLVWTRSVGAWGYVAGVQITGLKAALAPRGIDAPDRLELTGVAVSESDTTLTLPSELGLFEIGGENQEILRALQDGFPADVSVNLTVAAVDRNYVNAVRGGGFNPSGTVRISSVVGDGVGVFGSVFPVDLQIAVGDDLPFPSCLSES